MQAVASKVSDEELARAKKATISSVLMNLESRAVVAEDIGRQVLTYGHRCVSQLSQVCMFHVTGVNGGHTPSRTTMLLHCLLMFLLFRLVI